MLALGRHRSFSGMYHVKILHQVPKAFLVGGNHAGDRLASVKDRWVVFEGPAAFDFFCQSAKACRISTLCVPIPI